MRVLVLGSGAREHALVARLLPEAGPEHLICAPGNPGIARLARIVATDLNDLDAVVTLSQRESIDLTIVGPEHPLSLGIADRCLEIMVTYARERKAFGRPLSDFGQIQRYIGESYAMIPGPRIVLLLEDLMRAIHPEATHD